MNKLQKFWRLVAIAAIMASALNLGLMPTTPVRAASTAVSLTDFSAYSQNFDAVGTSATATLPTDWKADKQTTARVVGTYAAAVSATEQRAGNTMSSTAGNGIYNYGAGDPTTATDRAIGFISSSSATKSGNLYAYLKNETGNDLSSFTISYDVEKYRNGSNTAGFSVQLYYSFNGIDWTSAGSNFLTSFPADADNNGYASAPGATTSVSNQTLTVAVPSGSNFYLAWNYAVTSGTTTSNAQGLGIDNVSITPVSAVPPLPSLSIDDVSVTEGNSGTTLATFTVSLSAVSASDVTFYVATSDGTATLANSDYAELAATQLTIVAGQPSKTFDVTVNGDTDIEPDETFNVTLSSPVGATISDDTGIGTITNDDFPALGLSVDDVSLAEGNSGDTTFTFTATLSNPAPAGGVTFEVTTADGTATLLDNDYVAVAGTPFAIAEGETTQTFAVTVNGDTTLEADETFTVNLSNATNGATIVDGQGLGTITNDDLGLSINDVSVTEGNAGTTTANFTVSLTEISASDVTFNIATADNTATVADNDYVAKSVTPATIPAGSTTYTFGVTVNGDLVTEPNETFYVNLSDAPGATITDAQGVGTITNDDTPSTAICAIQGSGAATSMSGTHTIQGVVVGDFEGGASPQIRGYYVQQENCDADPATSDGVFVYNNYNPSINSVALGDLVRVTGTVSEYQGQTQVSASSVVILSSGNAVAPTDVTLPFTSEAQKEQYEGMLVRFTQPLTVTEHYLLGRFGQVTLSGNGKLWQPTGIALPGAPAAAVQAANNLNKIILDDSDMSQNLDPILFGRGGLPLSASNTLRGGDTVSNLTGVLVYNWGGNSASPNAYRILPVNAMGGGSPNFVAVNQRPATPPVVGGTLKVVGMNLLNYFNTFTNCINGLGGTPSTSNCRGAENTVEFERQAAKTVAAIVAMDADVIGIVEIENDGYASTSAIYDLVSRLNAAAGAGTYAFVDVDAETGLINAMGTDGIKNGLIYKPAKVSMVGNTSVLDTVAFVNGGDSAPRNRVSLLQAFEEIASGETFLVNVNHLKSKGSACNDPDTNDGQGNCAIVRTNAAYELADWIALDNPTGTGDPDVIILGDLNSYAMEDPIAALEGEGYTDLGYYFNGEENYSYVFDGQWGYLDYAMASESLLDQVVDAQEWHINSDEPSVLDYNTNFKSAGQITSLYAPDQYRISDHDPIMVGLNLGSAPVDTTPPTVTSINRANANPTNAASVDFSVVFSEAVSGVAVADFALNTSGTISGATVSSVSGSGTTYTVTVLTGTGSGTIRLDIPNTATIADLAGNPLAGLPYTAGQAYDIDQTLPAVTSITRAGANPTNAASVTFSVVFSEAVSGVAVADFALNTTGAISGAAVSNVSGSGATYTVTVSTGTGSGTIRLDIPGTATIVDASGNALTGLPYTSGQAYDLDKTLPAVTSITRASANPTNAASVTFSVVFSEAVSGVAVADFALNASGTISGATIDNVSGSGTTYTVTVLTGTGSGTIRLDIPNTATIVDALGNALTGLPYQTGEFFSVRIATFADVPVTYWAWSFVERLYAAGVTGGCGTSPLIYCPDSPVTREQMAVFLLKSKYGPSYNPPVASGEVFSDVPLSSIYASWIEKLASEGITAGCGDGSTYCPGQPVTRAQMAVFLLKSKYGASYSPADVTDTGFADVAADYWAAKWIKQLAAEGITAGCGEGNYCPEKSITRAEMAVFLVKTFELP